ncbi:MAG: hypothetical protein RIR26_1547 [Pseudomonadota bacterium]
MLPLFVFVGCGLTSESATPVTTGASATAGKITAAGKSETSKSQVGAGDNSKENEPAAHTPSAAEKAALEQRVKELSNAVGVSQAAASAAPGTILGGCKDGEAFGQATNCGGTRCDIKEPTFSPTCPAGSRYQGVVTKSGGPFAPVTAGGLPGGSDSPQTGSGACTLPWKQLQRCYQTYKNSVRYCENIPTAEAFKYSSNGNCIKG